jgi:putative ABC transport system permease protein
MTWTRLGHDLRVGIRNFRRSRLQAVLAILAATAGTGGVVVCTSYVAAGREKIFDQFRRMGTNLVIVTPQQSRAVGGRARTGSIVTTLRDPDYRAIMQEVFNITASSPTASSVFRVRAGDLTKSATIVGCLPAYFSLRNWTANRGDLFDAVEERRASHVALIGATAARDLFGASDPVGRRIRIGSVPFTVAGVLQERGQGIDAANEDGQIYIPLKTATVSLLNRNYYDSLLFEIDSWKYLEARSEDIASLLQQRHRALSVNGPDFAVQNQKSLLETQLAEFKRLTFLVRAIAATLLMIAAVGIFGLAWLGIGNRRREIGTCRALGATTTDVLAQHFAESFTGPVIGSALGIALGWPLLRSIDARSGQPFVFSANLAVEAAFLSILLYIVATLTSCWRATGIEPSIVLRSE